MTTNEIRVIKLSMGGGSEAPFALGKQGASWFICFARPYGARGIRKWACLNLLLPPRPFLQPSTDGHPRFVWNSTPSGNGDEYLGPLTNPSDGPALLKLTNEQVGGSPVVEVMLSPSEILHPCASCRKWETISRPRFKACGACKSVYYCSEEVRPSVHPSESLTGFLLVVTRPFA